MPLYLFLYGQWSPSRYPWDLLPSPHILYSPRLSVLLNLVHVPLVFWSRCFSIARNYGRNLPKFQISYLSVFCQGCTLNIYSAHRSMLKAATELSSKQNLLREFFRCVRPIGSQQCYQSNPASLIFLTVAFRVLGSREVSTPSRNRER